MIVEYKELTVNNAIKVESILSQIEQWSILNNVINYIQYSNNPIDFYTVTVRPVNNKKLDLVAKDKGKDNISLRIDLTDIPNGLKEEYLDMYEGVTLEILNTTRFDENTYLSTTYLGKLRMTRGDKLNVEERFPITKQGYTVGKLLDGTECHILLDIGQVNHLCLNPNIYIVNHFICCQNLHVKHREFK